MVIVYKSWDLCQSIRCIVSFSIVEARNASRSERCSRVSFKTRSSQYERLTIFAHFDFKIVWNATETDMQQNDQKMTTVVVEPSSHFYGIESLILAAGINQKKQQQLEEQKKTQASTRTLRTWDESFKALEEYKKRHGDCRVPVRYRGDTALANWVRYQQRNQDTLSDERRDKLIGMGFQFGARNDRQWNEKFKRLQAYQYELDSGSIPARSRDSELAQWVSTQRSLFKKNLLRQDRRQRLESIGFTWAANSKMIADSGDRRESKTNGEKKGGGTKGYERNAQWRANYERLKQFHIQHGHFNIPNRYEKDPALGVWCSNQRSIYHRRQLHDWRLKLLNDIGFVWRADAKEARAEMYQKQWDQQFEGLVKFKEHHGHVDVPHTFADRALVSWVGVQKETGRRGALDCNRAERLLLLGLTWGEEREHGWNKSYIALQAYLKGKAVGTTVHLETMAEGDTKVGNWIQLQCTMKNYHQLSIERICLLEAIGLKWEHARVIVSPEVPAENVPAMVLVSNQALPQATLEAQKEQLQLVSGVKRHFSIEVASDDCHPHHSNKAEVFPSTKRTKRLAPDVVPTEFDGGATCEVAPLASCPSVVSV
jgi:Helicase associated domain